MSVLETPRILFRGQIAWDPIVTNNRKTFYDENSAETVLPNAASTQQQVASFRQEAIAAVVSGGNWNPHGTHRSTFFDTEVTGVDIGMGVDTSDPFVGAPVDFVGMLVDCEPYGSVSSQLFFDTMDFGIQGGCRISGRRSTRMVARYVNFTRNSHNQMIAGVASVVWQTSFHRADLTLDAHGSPALQDLRDALTYDDALGLTVRWNSYRTIYYGDAALRNQSPEAATAARRLLERLNAGGFQPNPACSLIVGVVGLWRHGEPAQEPGDRPLLAATPSGMVATAHARLERQTLTIDLANSVAETDADLTKQNLGTLNVVAVADDNLTVVAPLGTLNYHQYDRIAYEGGAGIVTLPIDPAHIDAASNNNIQIRGIDGTVYLAETPYRALPTEHNRYLDANEPATTTAVQLYVRGVPGPAGINVTMYDASHKPPVEIAHADTDANGVATFTIKPIAGGKVQPYLFIGGPDPEAPRQLNPQLTPYMYVRTLPADQATAKLPPTWDNVYSAVLANWNAMAPCMDNWLRLDKPAQVKAYAGVLKKLTDPANFESFRFMPVTRDMTTGERTLLWNFLDAPPEPPEVKAEAPQAEERRTVPPERDLAKLSRAMRGN